MSLIDTVVKLSESPLVRLALVLATIVTLALRLVTWRRLRRTRRLAVHSETTLLIENLQSQIPNFEASYNNHPIETLAVSTLTLWNSGTEEIRPTDFAPTEPLRVQLQDSCKVLEHGVVKQTAESVQFGIESGLGESLLLHFDYLNPGDGAVVRILHTGHETPKILGSLIGPRTKIDVEPTTSFRIPGYKEGGLILSQNVLVWVGLVSNFLFGILLFLSYLLSLPVIPLVVGLALMALSFVPLLPEWNAIPKRLR